MCINCRATYGNNIPYLNCSEARVDAEILFRSALHEIANGIPSNPGRFAADVLGGAADPKKTGYWPSSVFSVGEKIEKILGNDA